MVVVGHAAQVIVDPVLLAFAAALQVYAWKAVRKDVSISSLGIDDSMRAYQTTRGQLKDTSYLQL